MRSFEVSGRSPAEVVAAIRDDLDRRDLSDFVRIELDGDRMEVRLSYLGTTKLLYRLERTSAGFVARLEDERIARVHGPFVARFQGRFGEALARIGARPVPE